MKKTLGSVRNMTFEGEYSVIGNYECNWQYTHLCMKISCNWVFRTPKDSSWYYFDKLDDLGQEHIFTIQNVVLWIKCKSLGSVLNISTSFLTKVKWYH